MKKIKGKKCSNDLAKVLYIYWYLKSYFYDLNKQLLLKRLKANTLQYLENYQLINILDFC